MVITCYAVKGGSGTTVVAAGLALGADRSPEHPIVLVDLAGDLALAFDVPHSGPPGMDRPGVGDWLASGAPADHLVDLAVEVADGVALVPTGRPTGPHPDRWHELAAWLADRPGVDVVVDAGLLRPERPEPGPLEVLRASTRRVLVTRLCYLAVDRARRSPIVPTAVVVVEEPGRALRRRDLRRSVGAPVVATVPWDPRIARAVDAGLVRFGRLPRPLLGLGRAILANTRDDPPVDPPVDRPLDPPADEPRIAR